MDREFKHVFYDKLTFIYLEMPKFNKTEEELDGLFEKWMFVLKNLYRLLDRPKALQERIFTQLFEQAEIAKYTPAERIQYENSVKVWRDNDNTVNTAYDKGFSVGEIKGKAEEKLNTAKRMKSDGLSADLIAKYTGLSIEEINQL